MPFRLSKEEFQQRAALVEKLEAGATALANAVETYNAALEAAKGPLEAALEVYNELLDEARGFAQDVASQADQDISEKSERWQESDKGQAAQEWKGEWEDLSLDDVEIELPEPIDFGELQHAGDLESAPEEMSE